MHAGRNFSPREHTCKQLACSFRFAHGSSYPNLKTSSPLLAAAKKKNAGSLDGRSFAGLWIYVYRRDSAPQAARRGGGNPVNLRTQAFQTFDKIGLIESIGN